MAYVCSVCNTLPADTELLNFNSEFVCQACSKAHGCGSISYRLTRMASAAHLPLSLIKVFYRCPKCGIELESTLAEAGNTDHCPACKTIFNIPGIYETYRKQEQKKQRDAKVEKARQQQEQKSLDAKRRESQDLAEKDRRTHTQPVIAIAPVPTVPQKLLDEAIADDGRILSAPSCEIIETIKCPFCSEAINAGAKKCKHCGEWLNRPALSPLPYARPQQSATAQQPPRSYVNSAVVTLILYVLGFGIVGLVVNFVYLASARTEWQRTGQAPEGRGCLVALLWAFFWIPLIIFVVVVIFILICQAMVRGGPFGT